MHVRRLMAADMIAMTTKLLAGWEERLRNPPDIVLRRDGTGSVVESSPFPEDAMVVEVLDENDTIKLRAELAAIASALEGLAST